MTRPPTVLLAPDKFKGTLTAAQVAAALAEGIAQTAPEAAVLTCPIADGGDGTVDAALAAGFEERTARIHGPTGEPRTARWALDGRTAVLELALAVGLQALPQGHLAPETSSTRGLGELIRAAIESGADTLLVGLGGSASTDAGAGLLQGLGARLLDATGDDIAPGLAGLAQLESIDLDPARQLLHGVRLIVAGDVTNPLLGPQGAVAVYGPQKGITGPALAEAEERLAAAAQVMDPDGTLRALPGAGAAGGTGFGLLLLGAEQRSGAEAVFDLVGLDPQLERADLVVTGQGKLDEQTLHGKGPAEVARRARQRGLPAVAVAGTVTLSPEALRSAGISHAWGLTMRAGSTERALAEGEHLLVGVGREIGEHLTQRADA